jgi:protein ImuB
MSAHPARVAHAVPSGGGEGLPAPAPLLPPTPHEGSRRCGDTLCLWLPTFELRLELVRSPGLDSTSVALLAMEEGVRRTIHQVSERAAEAGVRPGMPISQAVSLCPSLTLLEPDPAHYAAAGEEILEALSQVTPIVEPAGSGRTFLGMDGMDRLHGPPLRQIEQAFRALFQVLPPPLVAATRAGWAPGTFGAWVAAVAASPGEPVIVRRAELSRFLSGQSLSSLPSSPLLIQRLERLGVQTLGQLARFPEAALIAQFGRAGREALELATGRRLDPVRPIHRPTPIRVSLDFPSPIGQLETLHGALLQLVDRALARPDRAGRSIRGVRITGRLEGGGSWEVDSVLREPCAQRERIAFPLRSRMTLSPPPRALESLLLECFDFGPPATQNGLFDRSEASGRDEGGRSLSEGELPAALREAVRELRLKIGYSPLYRVVELDPWSRIPERRHALLPFEP